MRECPVNNLQNGMILGQPLQNYIGTRRMLLLARGTVISDQIVDRLKSIGYPFVYIEEPGTEEIIPEDILSEETRNASLMGVSQFYDDMSRLIQSYYKDGKNYKDLLKTNTLRTPSSNQLRENLRNILQDLFVIGSVRRYLTNTLVPKTNAIHQHALNVTILSLLIGFQYTFTDTELFSLGMGALFHDIGKMAFPDLIEKKSWQLTMDERAMLKEHSDLGEKLMLGSRIVTEVERQIVVQHHERQDGTGYPAGLRGTNRKPVRSNYTELNHIFRFAEIVSVADVFDNLSSGSTNGTRHSPSDVIAEMMKEAGTRLNAEIVRVLPEVVTFFPVGSNVKILRHIDSQWKGASGVIAVSDNQSPDEMVVIILFDPSGRRIPSQRVAIRPVRGDMVQLILS